MNKPEIGTKMYFVKEHLYRIQSCSAPTKEYCVCEAEVTGFYTGGYTEVVLSGRDPHGHKTLYYYKLAEVGKSVFYTPREAAISAQEQTEEFERTWGWFGAPDIPMRRPWAGLLCLAPQ